MHRIDGYGHLNKTFTEGDPVNGVPATDVTDEWLNAVQEEVAGVIEMSGLTLDKADNTQLKRALYATYTVIPQWFEVKAGDPSAAAANTINMLAFINYVTSNEVYGFVPPGKYYFDGNLLFSGSNWSISGPPNAGTRWDDKSAAVEFLFDIDNATDMMTIGAAAGSNVENFYLGNISLLPVNDYAARRGLYLDGSTDNVANRGYIRGGELERITVFRANDAGIDLRGNVFDVKGNLLSSRKNNGACFKTTQADAVVTGQTNPDQIDLFSPMLFSLPQGITTTNMAAWALDARGVQVFGGNIQGSLGARLGFASSLRGTHIENDQGVTDNNVDTFGVRVVGLNTVVEPKYIAGYGIGLQTGDPDNPGDAVSCRGAVPLIDCKSITGSEGVNVVAGGNRQSKIEVMQIVDAATDVVDNRGLGEFHLVSIRSDNANSFNDTDVPDGGTIPVNRDDVVIFNYTNNSAANVTLDAVTAIADGYRIGQKLLILYSGADSLIIPDAANTQLPGSVNVTLDNFDVLELVWDGSSWRGGFVSAN